jgi:mono/diheme cytochrome c family protein
MMAEALLLRRAGSDPIIVDAAISGLKGQEVPVLNNLLRVVDVPPTTEAVSMLAAAIAKNGDAAAVQRVIDAAVDISQPAWRQTALLHGLEVGLPVPGAGGARGGRGGGAGGGGLPGLSAPGGRVTMTAGRGVKLPAEPSALVALSTAAEPFATAARALLAKLDWNGKPAPAAPTVVPLTADEQKRFDEGKQVFANLCAACHNPDGQGKDKLGANLVTSKYVQANPQIAIRILTGGKEGPIGLMPPVTGALTDAQIAAALTYIRREWGHTASPVSEIDVRELRQSTSFHKGPWSDAELSSMLTAGRGRGGGHP